MSKHALEFWNDHSYYIIIIIIIYYLFICFCILYFFK